ncbi:MAG: DUF1934 domain-containing protein [Oscillospiraceae bacterium]|nr:DUF1934 domain-containing protein [Oscillospiraceae bacterium]
MKRNAKITIHGKDAAFVVRGTWERTAEGWRLAYDEPDASEMGAVRTELSLTDAGATLTRTGAVRSAFRFAEGAPHSSVYETRYGSFPAEVETHALRAKLGEDGGLIEIRYRLTIGGAADGYRLKILVRTEEEA